MPTHPGRHRPLIGLLAGLLLTGLAAADDRRFTPEELRADLAFIGSEIQANHPDPAHSVDSVAFERTMQALQSDLDAPLTRDQAWAALATLNPSFADAHLAVLYPNWRGATEAHLAGGGTFFPFEVSIADDGTPVVTGTIDEWTPPQPDNALRFDGKTHVLIGRSTYSSAILFANVLQDFGFATLAGAAPTARAEQSGGVQQSVLPNTGLMLGWPRFVLERPSGAGDPVLLTPDVVVEDDPLRPRGAVEAVLGRESAACS